MREAKEAAREFGKFCSDLTPKETAYLVKKGIHEDALGWNGGQWAIKGAGVHWEAGLWFDFVPEAKRAAIIACKDESGCVVDLAAWSPQDDRVALMEGNVAMLGQEQVLLARVGIDKLWAHATVTDWLRQRRRGIVIVSPDRARALLAAASPIAVRSTALKVSLEAAWRAPEIKVFEMEATQAMTEAV